MLWVYYPRIVRRGWEQLWSQVSHGSDLVSNLVPPEYMSEALVLEETLGVYAHDQFFTTELKISTLNVFQISFSAAFFELTV